MDQVLCVHIQTVYIHIVLIRSEKLTRVALQFPDSLLHDSHNVISQLQVRPLTMMQIVDKLKLLQDLVGESVKLYILGDTTFGECCVDEIAAEHCSSDGVIHFGHTCLTPTARWTLLKFT